MISLAQARRALHVVHRDRVKQLGLAHFVRKAWPQVVTESLVWNWHLDLICEALERLARRETRKLCIQIPPGCTKTVLCGIMFPSWVWAEVDPARKLIAVTFGDKLTIRTARRQRDLVNSPWYRSRWPEVYIPHQNTHAAADFQNNRRGFRFSTTPGGAMTGNHGDDIIGDDLNKAQDTIGSASDIQTAMDRSWETWSGVLPTRLSDPATTTQLLVGQRLHVNDVPGRWVESDPTVEVICLPMRGNPNHPLRHPLDNRAEGDLLWRERWPEEEVVKAEKAMSLISPALVSAQFGQDPIPPGGRLLSEEYLSHRYDLLPGELRTAIARGKPGAGQVWRIYGDMAFKGKPKSPKKRSRVCLQLWVGWQGRIFLVDQVLGFWGFHESKVQLRDFANRWPIASCVRLEDAANAAGMEDDIREAKRSDGYDADNDPTAACPIPVELVSVGGGALVRTQRLEGHWKAGDLVLPSGADFMGGSDGFVAEHLAFDGTHRRHDDQVATSSLAGCDMLIDEPRSKRSSWKAQWCGIKVA